MANNKHLIIDDRITISQMLRERKSFKEIGESLNKDPSTISKEIRNHTILSKTGCHGHAYNNCIHRYTYVTNVSIGDLSIAADSASIATITVTSMNPTVV